MSGVYLRVKGDYFVHFDFLRNTVRMGAWAGTKNRGGKKKWRFLFL
jgi:hypothetical protein